MSPCCAANAFYVISIFPYSERRNGDSKRTRDELVESNDFASEDSVFRLLAANSNQTKTTNAPKRQLTAKEMHSFAIISQQQHDDIESDIEEEEEEQKPTTHLPVDWSLKSKLRILSDVPIPGGRLKSNEEASGITGFVYI